MSDLSTTIVICSHLRVRWPWLCRAVDSALAQRDVDAKVLVVVDGDPELGELASTGLDPRVEVVVRAARGGLSAARNTALERVDTALTAFLDDDATAEPYWLAHLLAQLVSADVLGVGGRSEPDWEAGSRPGWFPEESLWAVGCSYRGMPDAPSAVRNVFGGCAVYRTSVLQAVGGFREDLGRQATGAAGCEETELCLRAVAHHPGSMFMYSPQAIIHHHVPRSRATVGYLLERAKAEGRSKAFMATITPAGQPALSTERSYLWRVVAPNVLRAFRHPFAGGAAGPRCAAVLVATVAVAGSGFVTATARHRLAAEARRSAQKPVMAGASTGSTARVLP